MDAVTYKVLYVRFEGFQFQHKSTEFCAVPNPLKFELCTKSSYSKVVKQTQYLNLYNTTALCVVSLKCLTLNLFITLSFKTYGNK